MPSVLKEKIAGMTDQQAAKLSRELLLLHPNMGYMQSEFPLLDWLCKKIKLEGTLDEQIHLCPACRQNNHKYHAYDYLDHDGKVFLCHCGECAGNPPPKPPKEV